MAPELGAVHKVKDMIQCSDMHTALLEVANNNVTLLNHRPSDDERTLLAAFSSLARQILIFDNDS